MPINLMHLDEKRFEELCQALLNADLDRFQAFSAPDHGMDGYDSDSETVFQAYFPEREPRRDKIAADIAKARAQGGKCKRWVLLLPKNPTPALSNWINEAGRTCPFLIEVWGKTKISALLQKHEQVKEQFFPTELQKAFKRFKKGKKPAFGDAHPGQEIDAVQSAELREIVEKLAGEAAQRKRWKLQGGRFQAEWGEFNSHFKLSSYDRLPAATFLEARHYLETKLYARRSAEPQVAKNHRARRGIKSIQRTLRMGDTQYRCELVRLTGKSSTTEMEDAELNTVFKHFQRLQGEMDARSKS